MSEDKLHIDSAVCAPTAEKICGACGEKFVCSAHSSGCWCEKVKLSQKTLGDLRARYSDCLCPRCLAQASEEHKE